MAAQEIPEDEMNLYREIRRKGKNRQAAKKSRKKRLDQIDFLRTEKENAKAERDRLKSVWKSKSSGDR